MNYPRFLFTSLFLCLFSITSMAQFRIHNKSIQLYLLEILPPNSNTGFLANQSHSFYHAPMLSGTAARPFSQMNSYWLTRMTTQSFNEGKMGTNYFWDYQGNLRESRFFVEVGGKSKPGLKLVFPRR